jgi:ArsR family transcriptional regulator
MYKLKADVIAAAGNPIRLAIIDFLKDGEQCVCDIAEHVDAQRSNVSRHLTVLLRAGIVEQRKDGLKMIYSLKTPCIVKFTQCVEGVLREQAKDAAVLLKAL